MEVLFVNTIVFVKDINISKDFYSNVLGLKILNSYPSIVWFNNNFAIHKAGELFNTIFSGKKKFKDNTQGNNNIDIYFECDDLEAIYKKVVEYKAEIIHPIQRQEWGQYVFRFYDPDKHIVEIGGPLQIDFNSEDKKIIYK